MCSHTSLRLAYNTSNTLHLLKVLLPPQLLHLGTLQVHVLAAGVLSVGLDLALDGGVEGAEDARGQESGVDAVVDADGCNGDACCVSNC